MKTKNEKIICDVCEREIIQSRKRKGTGVEAILAFFLGCTRMYHYGDEDCDICAPCRDSFEVWQKSRRW